MSAMNKILKRYVELFHIFMSQYFITYISISILESAPKKAPGCRYQHLCDVPSFLNASNGSFKFLPGMGGSLQVQLILSYPRVQLLLRTRVLLV